jgi:hypothetical protein
MLHEKMFRNLQRSHRIVIGLCWQAAGTSLAGVLMRVGCLSAWIGRAWACVRKARRFSAVRAKRVRTTRLSVAFLTSPEKSVTWMKLPAVPG